MKKVFVNRRYPGYLQVAGAYPIMLNPGDVICAPTVDPTNAHPEWRPDLFAKRLTMSITVKEEIPGNAVFTMMTRVEDDARMEFNWPPRQYTVWRKTRMAHGLERARSSVPMNEFHSQPLPLP